MLHRMSDRSDRPFRRDQLRRHSRYAVRIELFGFEKGSFTGAHYARKGKAVLAHGGTLFLDEIGELSPYSQSKLLRVLEEKEVYPIGADRPVHVDLRLIAATNRSVEDNIRTGQFLAPTSITGSYVARVVIPDLADRPDDIPLLHPALHRPLQRALSHACHDARCSAARHPQSYDWPGNIREIRNFVEAVFIDLPDGAITRQHIPLAFEKLHHMYVMSGEDERQRILDAPEQTNWNKVEVAAKALALVADDALSQSSTEI